MRILLVSEDVPVSKLGGAGKHAILLGNTLIEAGHDVEFLGGLRRPSDIVTNNEFKGKFHTLIDMQHAGLKEAATGIFNPLRQLLMANRVWRAIKQLDYKSFDVIHYHGHIAELGVLIPKHINYVHTLHDQGSECMTKMRFREGKPCISKSPVDCASCATPNPNLLQIILSACAVKLHRKLALKAFKKHKAIFVSEFLQQRFKSIVANSNGLRSDVVHNFTDVKSIKEIVNTFDYKQVKIKSPIALIVGRVDKTKGQEEFLDALPTSVFERLQIQVVGDGNDLERLKQKFSNRNVNFLGFKSQKEVYMLTTQASVCIVPSVCEEAFGTTTLEAIVLGKPVLALNIGGTPELVRYNIFNNQLQLFDDIKSLANSLSQLEFSDQTYPISFKGDITARLPDVINVYKKGTGGAKNKK